MLQGIVVENKIKSIAFGKYFFKLVPFKESEFAVGIADVYAEVQGMYLGLFYSNFLLPSIYCTTKLVL